MKSARNTAKRWCDGIALAFWLAFGLACLLNWARPGMSFDLTPYLGLTAAADVTNDAQVQASSYEELHKVATPQQWSDLTESNPYVQQMKDNPSLFSRDLGDYRMKWGYIELARILSIWTSPYTSLRLITLGSLLIILGATVWLLWSSSTLQSLFIIAPVFMAGEFNYEVGSTTPDLLALALTGLLLIAWLRRSRWLIIALSVCCVAVRPDISLMIAGIFVASMLFGQGRLEAGLSFACSAVVLAGERLATSYVGWWQHVSAALYGSTAVMSGARPFSLTGYMAAWLWQLVRIAATGTYFYVIALLVITYVGLSRHRRTTATGFRDVVFYGVLLGLLGRMIVFPTTEPRFFLPTLFIMAVIVSVRLRVDFSEGVTFAFVSIRRAWFPEK